MLIRLKYFNPQGPRGPRPLLRAWRATFRHFNPQGPRGPRHLKNRTLTVNKTISIHKALAGLDSQVMAYAWDLETFQSTRPSRASTKPGCAIRDFVVFQSTRPSRASTAIFTNFVSTFFIFLNIMLHFYLDNLLSLSKNSYFPCPFPTFSSANIPSFPCPLHIRIKKSTVLSHQIRALLLYAPPYFYIGSPDNKISGCLYLYR